LRRRTEPCSADVTCQASQPPASPGNSLAGEPFPAMCFQSSQTCFRTTSRNTTIMDHAMRTSIRAIRGAPIRRACNVTSESCSASHRQFTTSVARCQSNASTTFVRRAAPANTTPAQPVRPAVSTAQPTKPVGTTTTAQLSPGPFSIRKGPLPPVQTERNTLANPPQEPILDLSQSGLSDQPPASGTSSEENVDWTTSFSGLSSQAFSKEAADILLQPIEVDDIEIKADGILYLPEIKYRRILNRAFGPGGWGLAPRGETIVTAKCVTREYALVANGRYVACLYPEGSMGKG